MLSRETTRRLLLMSCLFISCLFVAACGEPGIPSGTVSVITSPVHDPSASPAVDATPSTTPSVATSEEPSPSTRRSDKPSGPPARSPTPAAATLTPIGHSVTGTFTYGVPGEPFARGVSVDAHGDTLVLGSWTIQDQPDGPLETGSIDCLLVQGDDAFMFGSPYVSDRAAFLWIHDGRTRGGAGDLAVTWMQASGQLLSEMADWCRNAGLDYPGPGPFPVTSGDVIIRAGS